MKTRWISTMALGVTLAVLAPARRAHAQLNPMCEQILPVTVVEKVTGSKGVKNLAPEPKKGAGGDCDYGQDYDHLLFMVTLQPSGGDWAWKSVEGVTKGPNNVKLSGVGDVAYSSGGTIVAARKGNMVFVLSSFNGAKGVPSVQHMSEMIRQMFSAAQKMGFK